MSNAAEAWERERNIYAGKYADEKAANELISEENTSLRAEVERYKALLDDARELAASNNDGPHPYDLREDTSLTWKQRKAIREIIAAVFALPAAADPESEVK